MAEVIAVGEPSIAVQAGRYDLAPGSHAEMVT